MALDRYFHLDYFNQIKKAIKLLDGDNSDQTLKLVCKKLHINYSKLKNKTYADYNIKCLLLITWYSYDSENKDGFYISQKKIKQLQEKKDLKINDLVGLYKAGQNDLLEEILNHEKFYLIGTVKKSINAYIFQTNSDMFEDILSEAQMILIKAINTCIGREANQIGAYINIYVGKRVLGYIAKNYAYRGLDYDDKLLNEGEDQWKNIIF